MTNQDPIYCATYASLKAKGFPEALLHRATVAVVSKAARTGRTASSVMAGLVG